jgi:hypothetical protein
MHNSMTCETTWVIPTRTFNNFFGKGLMGDEGDHKLRRAMARRQMMFTQELFFDFYSGLRQKLNKMITPNFVT